MSRSLLAFLALVLILVSATGCLDKTIMAPAIAPAPSNPIAVVETTVTATLPPGNIYYAVHTAGDGDLMGHPVAVAGSGYVTTDAHSVWFHGTITILEIVSDGTRGNITIDAEIYRAPTGYSIENVVSARNASVPSGWVCETSSKLLTSVPMDGGLVSAITLQLDKVGVDIPGWTGCTGVQFAPLTLTLSRSKGAA